MGTIVVQRELVPGTEFSELQAAEQAVAWCLEQYEVRFLHSYLSLDGAKMVCLYEAPDAEAVRVTQRKAGLPLVDAWSALAVGVQQRACARPGLSTVIVERAFEAPETPDHVEAAMRAGAHCFANHRADLLGSHLACDGMRMVCVFEAPDAEAVRIVNRQIGVPFLRAWTASVHPGAGS